ncbi:hypothetical protein PC39_16193 [Salinisphaera sp. PC39]
MGGCARIFLRRQGKACIQNLAIPFAHRVFRQHLIFKSVSIVVNQGSEHIRAFGYRQRLEFSLIQITRVMNNPRNDLFCLGIQGLKAGVKA